MAPHGRLTFFLLVVSCFSWQICHVDAQNNATTKPHIVFIMADDFGWNNFGVHAKGQPNEAEVQTPRLDDLVANGILLDRHYVFRFCSPSRSAFTSGRNPIHVNLFNGAIGQVNPADPISGFSGIPRNMTGIAEKLASAGYSTVAAGKVSRIECVLLDCAC